MLARPRAPAGSEAAIAAAASPTRAGTAPRAVGIVSPRTISKALSVRPETARTGDAVANGTPATPPLEATGELPPDTAAGPPPPPWSGGGPSGMVDEEEGGRVVVVVEVLEVVEVVGVVEVVEVVDVVELGSGSVVVGSGTVVVGSGTVVVVVFP